MHVYPKAYRPIIIRGVGRNICLCALYSRVCPTHNKRISVFQNARFGIWLIQVSMSYITIILWTLIKIFTAKTSIYAQFYLDDEKQNVRAYCNLQNQAKARKSLEVKYIGCTHLHHSFSILLFFPLQDTALGLGDH